MLNKIFEKILRPVRVMLKTWFQISSIKVWFPWVWIGISLVFIILTRIWNDNLFDGSFSVDFSREGWSLFIDVFKYPLSFLAFFVPIYGIIVTLHRASQFEKSMDENKKQKLDNIFFSMLNLHHNLVNSIDLKPDNPTHDMIRGKDCFRNFKNKLKDAYSPKSGLENVDDFTEIRNKLGKLLTEHATDIYVYFTSLFSIIEFVSNSEMEDKQLYMNILKSHLSTSELILIFYYVLLENKAEYKDLIEKYHFFSNLPSKFIFNAEHKNYYGPNAFT